MRDYLKRYHVHLSTVGPVYIGSGKQFSKKEYMFLTRPGSSIVRSAPPRKEIGILDMQKMYALMGKKHKEKEFEQYLLNSSRSLTLQDWLGKQHIRIEEVRPAIRYTLDCGDTTLDRGLKANIFEFVKDPMGQPYIPGSSLKGMFRTLFLTRELVENKKACVRDIASLRQAVRTEKGNNRNRYLQRSESELEATVFRTLDRLPEKPAEAVNDWMAGFMVSDSEPLKLNDLVACQRYELRPGKYEPDADDRLNVIRECIRPGTRINFTISIDKSICQATPAMIRQAVSDFNDIYAETFLNAFKAVRRRYDSVYLGGGAGFGTKTVLYPALGKEDGIDAAVKIFHETHVPAQHGHANDHRLGVSPHIVKFSRYEGKYAMMGECKLEFDDTGKEDAGSY